MNWFRAFCFLISLAGICLQMGCASFGSYQTAQTIEKGKVSVTGGLGNNTEPNEAFLHFQLRTGIGDSTDIGLSQNFTGNGSTVTMLDIKRQINTQSSQFKSAFGGGIGAVYNDEGGVVLQIPTYFSYHSKNDLLAIYCNPRGFLYIDTAYDENTGLGFANSFGVKIGKKFAAVPEWSMMMGRYDGSFEVTHLLSVGLGFNIR